MRILLCCFSCKCFALNRSVLIKALGSRIEILSIMLLYFQLMLSSFLISNFADSHLGGTECLKRITQYFQVSTYWFLLVFKF